MIRLFHVYFPSRTLLLASSEAALITLALILASLVWSGSDAELTLVYEHGVFKILIVGAVCMLCMYYYDLYDSLVIGSLREALTRLIQVLGTACLVLALLYYAYPPVQLRRGLFVLGIVLAGGFLAAWRRLFLVFSRSMNLTQRTILLGAGPLARSLATEIEKRPELGVTLLGYVDRNPSSADTNGVPCLGTIEELRSLVEHERVDRVILTMADRRGNLPVQELLQLKTRGVAIEDGAAVYEAITGKVPIDSLRPSWLLLSKGFCVSQAMHLYKRAGSIVGSALALTVALPLMALIALAIRLESPGPVIFRQKRVGKDRKAFTLYKFRSMWHEADGNGRPKPAAEHDARITRVGRWLRRTRLDELPQLYNILRGDMCFIGPRPFTPDTEEECDRQIPFYSQRWAVKPGATGWAQVQRGYCASLEDNIDKLSCDLFYIKNLSIGLDCLILFQTIKILLLGRGAR